MTYIRSWRRVVKSISGLIFALSMNGCVPVLIGGTAVGVSMIHDRRSATSVLEDQRIEMALSARLDADKTLQHATHIGITSYNRVVLLTGQVSNAEVKAHIVNLARRVPEVNRVLDEITVSDAATFEDSSDDAYITSKVKLGLFDIALRDFDPTRVKVVTERGVVYLMGLLTDDEASAVVDKVRYVNGVRRVVEAFEYVEPRP